MITLSEYIKTKPIVAKQLNPPFTRIAADGSFQAQSENASKIKILEYNGKGELVFTYIKDGSYANIRATLGYRYIAQALGDGVKYTDSHVRARTYREISTTIKIKLQHHADISTFLIRDVIPIENSQMRIDWGDGTYNYYSSSNIPSDGNIKHNYALGDYTITITNCQAMGTHSDIFASMGIIKEMHIGNSVEFIGPRVFPNTIEKISIEDSVNYIAPQYYFKRYVPTTLIKNFPLKNGLLYVSGTSVKS